MAIPTISDTTSILGFDRGSLVNYQPFASDSPTSWAASNLPTGILIDSVTGLLSGTADDPGVFVVGLTATNGEGTSAVHEIAIGIGSEILGTDAIGVEIDVDLATGKAVLRGVDPAGDDAPTMFAKSGDQIFIDVGFFKDGSLQAIPCTQIMFTLKEYEGEEQLTLTSGVTELIGGGFDSRFRTMVDFDKTAIDNALSSYEGDVRTGFLGLAEIEWTYSYGDVNTAALNAKRSTQTFRVALDRDLI
ncbi:MAG: hypothetical protein GY872_01585 [Roseibacillus sp.]|nr:hypothetical protein [Myxococcales bacterium]MCP4728745.1 hypothetical protein [Roseibacillus sp.]